MAVAGESTAASNNTACGKIQEQHDELMSTLPNVFDPSELPSDKSTEVLLRELQEAGRVKSHCYSLSPSTQQLNLYWISPKGGPGSRACTVQSGGSSDCHGSQSGGCETPVGVASASDVVISRPDEDSLEEERRLKAELASLKEKLHKLTTLKLNENKTSASELEELTVRWRKAAQEAAEDISSCSRAMHQQPVNVGQLLDLLRIPHSLLRYSEEEETFTD